jgi:hypothetical protein
MPIEDVQFLQANSVQDSAMVFVDSSKRNRVFYPTPSEYVVTFEEPLRNVFGMDVLDATIPGTMYNVDFHNNRLRVITLDVSKSSALKRAAAAATVQGASSAANVAAQEHAQASVLSAEIFTLGFCARAVAWLSDTSIPNRNLLVMADAMFRDNLPPVDQTTDDGSGCAVLIRHIIAGVPLIPTKAGAAGSFVFMGKTFAVAEGNPELSKWVSSPEKDVAFALIPSSTLWSSSVFAGATAATAMYDIVYHRVLPITAGQYASYLASYGKPMSVGRAPLEVLYSMKFVSVTLELGNYTVATLLLQLQEKMRDAGIDVTSASNGTIDKQGIFMFTSDRDTRFMFCISSSTCGDLLGFDLLADVATNDTPLDKRGYTAVSFGSDERPFFMSIMKYSETALTVGMSIKAPGIANMLGVRYITLRCNEIEQHMSNVGKYGKLSTGIGVFKLASASEVAQLRFDFVSLIRRPFHPIGRLTRMTLRFEMTDGSLYDFKGINHQLLITLKYYSPSPATMPGGGATIQLKRSVLNPDYDPDFNRYLLRQSHDAARAMVSDRGYEDDLGEDEHNDEDNDEDQEDAYDGGRQEGNNAAAEQDDAAGAFDEDAKRRVLLLQYKNDFFDTFI